MTQLELLFTPADFETLKQRDLSEAVCVVFDVLRATSSMVTALANGAEAVIPVSTIPDALRMRRERPEVLLAGERDGLRIGADLTGSIAFDLGNSPREFTRDKVAGGTIVMTTTNGTRALRACAGARRVLVGSLLNLGATAALLQRERPAHLIVVCSGTFEETAYEDILAGGALCERLWTLYREGRVADSAYAARRLFLVEQPDLPAALAQSRNGKRLLSRPELREDVPFCAALDTQDLLAAMNASGQVELVPASRSSLPR
jgi:2-phosphosulfolactate phosphatase